LNDSFKRFQSAPREWMLTKNLATGDVASSSFLVEGPENFGEGSEKQRSDSIPGA